MLTPMDIHNKTFSKGLRGYAAEEVDQFLQDVVGDYEKVYREHREMEEVVDALRSKLKSYETMESTMTSTLMMAQETAENVKINARKEAELILANAESEKSRLLREAAESVRQAQQKYDQIVTEINIYRAKLRSLLESEIALVEQMVPDREVSVETNVAEVVTAPVVEETVELSTETTEGETTTA